MLPKRLASQAFADGVGVTAATIATFYQGGRLVLRMIPVGGQCGNPAMHSEPTAACPPHPSGSAAKLSGAAKIGC